MVEIKVEKRYILTQYQPGTVIEIIHVDARNRYHYKVVYAPSPPTYFQNNRRDNFGEDSLIHRCLVLDKSYEIDQEIEEIFK